MVKLGLLALGAAALVSATPVFNEDLDEFPAITTYGSPSTAKAFKLFALFKDPFNPLSSSVKGTYLNSYHLGAGLNLPVLHAIDAQNPGAVFYLNQKPGQPKNILTDSGPFPYSFNVPPPGEQGVQSVLLPVGDVGTPVEISNIDAPFGLSVINGPAGSKGSFLACKRPVPYYHNTEMLVLQYAYTAAVPQDCVPIALRLECAQLPAPQPNGPVSHQYVQTVPCFTKDTA